MQIIQWRARIEEVSFNRVFEWRDSRFEFPCNEDGTLHDMPEPARQNLSRCLAEPSNFRDLGVERRTHLYTQPAVGLCVRCEREVVLDSFTNTCECNADYNMSGQLLAHRSFWGEETSEDLSDILSIR